MKILVNSKQMIGKIMIDPKIYEWDPYIRMTMKVDGCDYKVENILKLPIMWFVQ